MSQEAPKHDLLFAAVASRLGLVTREALALALDDRTREPSLSLGQILVKAHLLEDPVRCILDRFVDDLRPYLSRELLNEVEGKQVENQTTQEDGLETTEFVPGSVDPGSTDPDSGGTTTHDPSADPGTTKSMDPPAEGSINYNGPPKS